MREWIGELVVLSLIASSGMCTALSGISNTDLDHCQEVCAPDRAYAAASNLYSSVRGTDPSSPGRGTLDFFNPPN
jgi:hypothetical protein